MQVSLYQKLCSDLMEARTNGSTITKSVLSCVIADAVMLATKKEKRNPTDDECLSVIKKAGVAQQSILDLGDKVNDSAREKARIELQLLTSYLPAMLTEDQLRLEISNYFFYNPGDKIGDLMGFLKRVLPNQYDGKMATTIAREFI